MKAKPSHPAFSMSTSLRVSPSIHGYHFDTASRKKAVGNIFENIDQEALQRLFKNSGDKKAEERAKIIFAIDQDLEEKTRAPPLNLPPGSVQPQSCSYPETVAVAPGRPHQTCIRVTGHKNQTRKHQWTKQ